MDTSLSVLVHDLRELLDAVDPETGELPAGIDRAELAVQQKALAVGAWIMQTEAEVQMVLEHARHLTERARTAQARARWLRGYLAQAMIDASVQRLSAADASVSVQVQAERDESVEILPSVTVPEAFLRTRIVREPDKVALRKAIINGEPLPEGIRLKRSHRLVIK